jgi:hypothetical protein
VEEFPAIRTLGAWMRVGDERFDGDDIRRLYESDTYPRRRRVRKSDWSPKRKAALNSSWSLPFDDQRRSAIHNAVYLSGRMILPSEIHLLTANTHNGGTNGGETYSYCYRSSGNAC